MTTRTHEDRMLRHLEQVCGDPDNPANYDERQLVRCPDCGQMEWWYIQESMDHGRCRCGMAACACES